VENNGKLKRHQAPAKENTEDDESANEDDSARKGSARKTYWQKRRGLPLLGFNAGGDRRSPCAIGDLVYLNRRGVI